VLSDRDIQPPGWLRPGLLNHLVRAAAWVALIAIVLATLAPLAFRPHVSAVSSASLERFAAYFTLALLFAWAYPKRLLPVLLLVIGSAIGLEALQLLIPDRHARLIDFAVKGLGASSGFVIGAVTRWFIRLRAAGYPQRPGPVSDREFDR
jgi:VanZ family protein